MAQQYRVFEFMPEETEIFSPEPTVYELIMMTTSKAGLRKKVVIEEFSKSGLLILEILITKKNKILIL